MSFSNHVKAVKFCDLAKEVMHNHKFVHLREDGVDTNLDGYEEYQLQRCVLQYMLVR